MIFAAFLSLCRYIGWPQFLLENTIWILLYYIGFIFQAYACQLAKGLEKVGDICIAGLIGTVTTIAACAENGNCRFFCSKYTGKYFSGNILCYSTENMGIY